MKFRENFLASSHARGFNEAAREWKVERYSISHRYLNCHVCNTTIYNFVVLQNTVNENRLVIGHDCYNKFIAFLRTGKVESQLPTRSEYAKKMRKHFQDNVPVMPREKRNRATVKTVRGWFEEQLASNALPEDIAAIVETMKALGFAPSIEDADRIVAHYKAVRKFPLDTFIYQWELKRYGPADLPKEVTLDELPEVTERVEAAKREALARAEQERREREARQEQEEREHWSERRPNAFSALQNLKKIFERVKEELPLLVPELTQCIGMFEGKTNAILVEYPGINAVAAIEGYLRYAPIRSVLAELEREISAESKKLQRWLDAPSREVVLLPEFPLRGSPRYVLEKEGDRWQRVQARFWNQNLPEAPTILSVRYLGPSLGWNKEKLYENFVAANEVAADSQYFTVIDISTPSTKHEGAFVGFWNRKVALPNQLITEPGRYLCFVMGMGEQEKYYRVWTIRKEGS